MYTEKCAFFFLFLVHSHKNHQKNHSLCLPVQIYFEKIAELTVRNSNSILFKQALVSLATDSGLHPLAPYFTCFIADEVLSRIDIDDINIMQLDIFSSL